MGTVVSVNSLGSARIHPLSFFRLGLQYTAPTDDALQFDLQVVKDFGMNVIRLHQKVNPQRWYLHADTVGVVVLQV